MAIVFVGIDLAKNVFAVHGVNEAGRSALVRPAVPRAKLAEQAAALPPCTIDMEACSGAHHCAREFQALGHTLWLMAPKFVAPYRLSGPRGKTNAADAAAICEAVQRPNNALRAAQERRAAGPAGGAPRPLVPRRVARGCINCIRGMFVKVDVVLPLMRRNCAKHLKKSLSPLFILKQDGVIPESANCI